MYKFSFNYKFHEGYRGLILHYYPVRIGNGSLKQRWLLGICPEFGVKDEVKEFCKKKGGSWCPLPGKFWWVPLDIIWDKTSKYHDAIAAIWQACKGVIDEFGQDIRMGGTINLTIEADMSKEMENFLQRKLLEQVELENARLQLQNNWEETPKLFNIQWVSDVDEENSQEYRGDEGHNEGDAYLSNGKLQKVKVYFDEPSQAEIEQQHRIHCGFADYRQFLAEDGSTYWCKPAFTHEAYDLGFWNDIEFNKEEVVIPAIAFDEVVADNFKPPVPKVVEVSADMQIKLVTNKEREPLCFRVYFDNEKGFRVLPLFKRLISERVYGKKCWDVPLECASELKKFAHDYSQSTSTHDAYHIEISSGAQQIFDREQ